MKRLRLLIAKTEQFKTFSLEEMTYKERAELRGDVNMKYSIVNHATFIATLVKKEKEENIWKNIKIC